MILKPCPFCGKSIPRAITVCPYCHRDEQGQPVQIDTAANEGENSASGKHFEDELKELSSEDPFKREQAVIHMAQRGFGVVQALVSILADHTKPGLAAIAKVLGRVRDRRAIPALIQAAKLGDEDLRIAAIWALTQFREPDVLPVLLSEVERPDPPVQGYLAYVLGSYQDARVGPVLARLTRHNSREVAFQAACALGETGDSQAIEALRKTAHRRDPVVREAALSSLRRLGANASESRKILFYGAGVLIAAILAGIFLYYR